MNLEERGRRRAEAFPHPGRSQSLREGDLRARRYRAGMGGRFRSFFVTYRDMDLWVGIDPEARARGIEGFILERATSLRCSMETYSVLHPAFLESLDPIDDDPAAPDIARRMIAAAVRADVGPMAAVAGAVAQDIGERAAAEFGLEEIVVENGGDIWMRYTAPLDVAVYAGDSPLSGRIGVTLPPGLSPCSVCTSSGTLGHSLSFGHADAAMIVGTDGAIADAWATSAGNMVGCADDIEAALQQACRDTAVIASIIVVGDRTGIRGRLPLRLFAAAGS